MSFIVIFLCPGWKGALSKGDRIKVAGSWYIVRTIRQKGNTITAIPHVIDVLK